MELRAMHWIWEHGTLVAKVVAAWCVLIAFGFALDIARGVGRRRALVPRIPRSHLLGGAIRRARGPSLIHPEDERRVRR